MLHFLFVFSGALRCCRRIVGLKDEFYNRYIVKGKLFDSIVESFNCNENRYNLLNSATVELFEFIRQVCISSKAVSVAWGGARRNRGLGGGGGSANSFVRIRDVQ